MKTKDNRPKAGDTVIYIGKGFIGYDKENPYMTFIETDDNSPFDVWVEYKGIKMLVMDHEIQLQ